MGLVYSKSESLNVIQAMEGNLTKAEIILGLLTSASQKLTGVLDVELKGKAYSSGLAVFDDIIFPTMKNARVAIEELSQGLTTYRHYDNVMPNEVLDEDNLNEQIRIRRNMMRSLDYHIRLLQQDSSGDNLVSQTNLVNDLYAHISTVEHEICLLQEKLRKLGEFSSRTSGLFSKGSDYLQGVLRGVNVLNHASVDPKTGTYILTGGVSLFDLHVPDVDIAAKAHKISPEFKIKVDGMTHYQLVQTFPYLSTLNPYQFVSDPAEIHRRRYVLSIAEIKRLKEYEHLIPKPQEDDRLTQIYAHIRRTGIDPTTGEPATGYQKWIAKHYSAISTSLSIAQISAGLWAGYRVYKSEVPTDKTAPKVGGNTTQG